MDHKNLLASCCKSPKRGWRHKISITIHISKSRNKAPVRHVYQTNGDEESATSSEMDNLHSEADYTFSIGGGGWGGGGKPSPIAQSVALYLRTGGG